MNKQNQDLIDAGNDILKSVTNAIDRNDYSTLAADISRTLKSVSIERKTTYSSVRQGQYQRSTYTYRNVKANPQSRTKTYPFLSKRISKYNGIGEMIGGFSLAVPALCVFIPMLALAITHSPGFWIGVAISAPLMALGSFLGFRGIKKLKLAQKLHKYGNILKDADYFKISDLAKVTLKTDEEVLKDVKDLIKIGYVPRAKLDAAETTCMITDSAYEMYLGAEQDRIAREARELSKQKAAEEPRQDLAGFPPKVQSILTEGEDYVKFVREINDIIPDSDDMSNKLYRLENIMNRIFEQVKKDPESADELHKLMNYYLPTTRKLLTAYVELDKQPEVGDNITKTKMEIDSAMDTINEAFEKLLDSLFQDMAWDISSDISVMKTMMAQDGLTSEGQGVAAQMQMK